MGGIPEILANNHVMCNNLVHKEFEKKTYNGVMVDFTIFNRDNYTLPTCGLPLILCTDPWFQF